MKIEVRSDSVLIDGYVNAVGRDSRVISDAHGQFVEQVVPGTFERALTQNSNVEVRLNHERVLGTTTDGTVELFEDNIGLRAKATITDAEVVEKARNRELRGWSFGFKNAKSKWEDREGAPPRRYLEGLELREVSIIDQRKIPAYIATSLEVRGEDEYIIEHRAFDDNIEYEAEPEPEENRKDPEEKRAEKDPATVMAGYRARKYKLTNIGGM